jgi:phospho-N-acetylmuramoyl-pentapeptide-transferase
MLSTQVVLFLVVLVATIIMGPLLIPVLRGLKFKQTIRAEGPTSHLIKKGTPTMGGIIFLIPLTVASLMYSKNEPRILPLILVTLAFGAIGFLDDFIKIRKKSKDGLFPKQKMLGLIVVSAFFSIYMTNSDLGTDIVVPFFGFFQTLDLGIWYIPFTMLVLIATTNAVNITDGLDGLAAGVTFFVGLFLAVVTLVNYDYLYIQFFTIALCAGCLGFLLYNFYPAKIFMGDTGSLALGGAIAAISIVLKVPLILIFVGGIFLVEALSVILQVASFKIRGKRIFKMAPLHHHFELSGFKETHVVYLFWGITLLLGVLSVFLLKIRFW